MFDKINLYIAIASAIIGSVLGSFSLSSTVRKWRLKIKLNNALNNISHVLKKIDTPTDSPSSIKVRCKTLKDLSHDTADIIQTCNDLDIKEMLKSAHNTLGQVIQKQLAFTNSISTRDKNVLYSLKVLCQDAIHLAKKYDQIDLQEQAEEIATRLAGQLRLKIRLYFSIKGKSRRDEWAALLLSQNQIQPLFQFQLMDQNITEEISTESKSETVAIYEEIIATYEQDYGLEDKDGVIRIVITDQRLPANFYLWGIFSGEKPWPGPFNENRFFVIGLESLGFMFASGRTSRERAMLRVVQRAAVLAVVPSLEDQETFGCLFDFTWVLENAQYFIQNAYICEKCSSEILKAATIPEGNRAAFLASLRQWLMDTSH